jgi:hypothetical protein
LFRGRFPIQTIEHQKLHNSTRVPKKRAWIGWKEALMMVLAIRQASTRVRVEKPPSLAEAGRNTKRAIDEPASSIEDPLLHLPLSCRICPSE